MKEGRKQKERALFRGRLYSTRKSEHNDMLTAPFRAIPQLRCMVRYVALGMMHNEIAQLGTSPSGPRAT